MVILAPSLPPLSLSAIACMSATSECTRAMADGHTASIRAMASSGVLTILSASFQWANEG